MRIYMLGKLEENDRVFKIVRLRFIEPANALHVSYVANRICDIDVVG